MTWQENEGNLMKIILIMAFLILIWLFCLTLNSCTYSINMVHTEGQASDVVDETQRADAKTNLNLPAI